MQNAVEEIQLKLIHHFPLFCIHILMDCELLFAYHKIDMQLNAEIFDHYFAFHYIPSVQYFWDWWKMANEMCVQSAKCIYSSVLFVERIELD